MSSRSVKMPLGEVLTPSDEAVTLDPAKSYREITVRLWGKGVTLRRVVVGAELAGQRRFVARAGQFVLSRIDARNGAFGLIPESLDGAVLSNDFPVFNVAQERLLSTYLVWMSRTAAFIELCRRASEGTTNRVRLQEDRFLAMEISLPSTHEQQRFVVQLEELAVQIETAKAHRLQATEQTKAIVQQKTSSVFMKLSRYATEPLRCLGVARSNPIQTGPFGAQLHASDFTETGVPVLNVGNVWPEGLRLDRLDHVDADKARSLSRYSLKSGDLLFARSGATLGKVCIVPKECDGWLMTGHLFRVRLDMSRISNGFAFAALRDAASVRDQVFRQIRGATRPGFNTTLLGNVELPIPPLSEQKRIVEEIDSLQAEVDILKRLQSETEVELNALLPSILNRAFRGELRSWSPRNL